ncbi:MAG: BlaI/MecI/CopY family transcriptional regulator [Lachnospiraceae bacterium]|nr:BlaI/MecI/CopY family transcriptional regulator [Lachnospiraceae bacterium]
MSKYKLSKRELETIQVLWNSESPLAITDIPKINSNLNVNTVAVSIRNLLKKQYIEIADVVLHGSSLTRTYRFKLSSEDYFLSQLEELNSTPISIMAALVKKEKNADELNQLEQIIKEQKALLEGEKQ